MVDDRPPFVETIDWYHTTNTITDFESFFSFVLIPVYEKMKDYRSRRRKLYIRLN